MRERDSVDKLQKTNINFNKNKSQINLKLLDTNNLPYLDNSNSSLGYLSFNPNSTFNRNAGSTSGIFNSTINSNRSRKNTTNNSMDFKFNKTTRKYIFGDFSMNYENLKPDSDNALRDYRYDSMNIIKFEEDFNEKDDKDNNSKNPLNKETLNKELLNKDKDINKDKDKDKNKDKDKDKDKDFLNKDISIKENAIPILKPILVKDKLNEIFENEYEKLYSTKYKFVRTVRFKNLESIHPESKTKIFIHNQNYTSPIKSYSVIKKNEVIFDNISKNYHEVQKHKYINFLKDLDEKTILSKPDFKKIKISQIISKKNKFMEISESQEKENILKEREKEKELKEKEKEQNCN
jgi:hypothetical protein